MGAWRDIVDEALKQISAIERGSQASDVELDEGFDRLKKVIRIWGVDGLKVPGLSYFGYDVAVGKRDYTIGTGDVDIEAPPLSELRSIDYRPAGMTRIHQLISLSYGGYTDRVSPNSIGPSAYYWERTEPISNLRFDAATKAGDYFRIVAYGFLAGDGISETDATGIPPEYELAMIYELAVQLGPSYGVYGRDLQDTRYEAGRLRRIIERTNRGEGSLRLDRMIGTINEGVNHGYNRYGRVNRYGTF